MHKHTGLPENTSTNALAHSQPQNKVSTAEHRLRIINEHDVVFFKRWKLMWICAIHEATFEMYVCKVMFRHGNVSELHNIRWEEEFAGMLETASKNSAVSAAGRNLRNQYNSIIYLQEWGNMFWINSWWRRFSHRSSCCPPMIVILFFYNISLTPSNQRFRCSFIIGRQLFTYIDFLFFDRAKNNCSVRMQSEHFWPNNRVPWNYLHKATAHVRWSSCICPDHRFALLACLKKNATILQNRKRQILWERRCFRIRFCSILKKNIASKRKSNTRLTIC